MSEEQGSAGFEVSIRDYLDIIRRRKLIIIQTFIVVLVIGVVTTIMAKTQYKSSTTMLVDVKTMSVAQIDTANPFSSLFGGGGHDLATQIEVLQGTEVQKKAYDAAKWMMQNHSDNVTETINRYKRAKLNSDKTDIPLEIPTRRLPFARLDIKQVGSTEVIQVDSWSEDRDTATYLAAAIPSAFLEYIDGNRNTELKDAKKFAMAQRKAEEEALNNAEAAMERFQRTQGYGNGKKEEQLDEKSAKIESRILDVETEVSSLSSSLSTLRAQRAATAKNLDTPTVTTNTTRIEGIKEKIEALKQERAHLIVKYNEKYIGVREIDSQIAQQEKTLANTPLTVTSHTVVPNPRIFALDSDIDVTRAKLGAKQAELSKLLASRPPALAGEFAGKARTYARLQRDVDKHKVALLTYSKSVEELRIRGSAGKHDPVTVITYAGLAEPVGSQRTHSVILAAILGLALGVCLALLQEYLDDRINSPDDARRLLEAPILSYVPMVEASDARILGKAEVGGSLLESYRVMRANVQFASVDEDTSSIVVTSTAPGEGKSVTASNLAVAMALDGKRVIVVDADLRRPTLHDKFGVDQRPGLTNVLVGHSSLDEAIKETDVEGLYVLPAGPLPPNPAELLNSKAMRHLHEALRERADVVIFDSPPFLATADSQILAAMADGVIYVVQFGEAKKSAVRHAVDLIHQAHAKVLGVVFNKIDLTSRRDDYYYGYYRYYNYYHSPQLESGDTMRPRSTREFDALVAGRDGNDNGNGVAIPGVVEERAKEESK